MEGSKKRLDYIVLLLVILIAGIAYYFGYEGYIKEAAEVTKEKEAIERQIEEVKLTKQKSGEYENLIADSGNAIDVILDKYGTGNAADKSIMFARELEKQTGAWISSASFTDDEPVYVSSITDQDGEPFVTAYASSLTMNYEMSYEGLKKALDFIHSYPERMNVENFTAVYNSESGQLTGTITVNLYAIQGNGRYFVEPYIPGIKLGTDNIFGTMD